LNFATISVITDICTNYHHTWLLATTNHHPTGKSTVQVVICAKADLPMPSQVIHAGWRLSNSY